MQLNQKSFHPIFLILIIVLILIAEYFSGPFIQFPITFLIPVALVSWYYGQWWGLVVSIILPLIRLYFNIALWTVPWTTLEASINAIIRISVLSSFALIIHRTAKQTKELSQEVELLEGLLSICSFCKKIRDDNKQWQPLEAYISKRTTATFSHGVCPECAEKHYSEFFKKHKERSPR
jgi:K+-sensing histidine kinase KdpD